MGRIITMMMTVMVVVAMGIAFSACSTMSLQTVTMQPRETVLHRACRLGDSEMGWQFLNDNEAHRERIFQVLQTPNREGMFPLQYCRTHLEKMSEQLVGAFHKAGNAGAKAQTAEIRSQMHIDLMTLNSLIEEMQVYWERLLEESTEMQLVIVKPQ